MVVAASFTNRNHCRSMGPKPQHQFQHVEHFVKRHPAVSFVVDTSDRTEPTFINIKSWRPRRMIDRLIICRFEKCEETSDLYSRKGCVDYRYHGCLISFSISDDYISSINLQLIVLMTCYIFIYPRSCDLSLAGEQSMDTVASGKLTAWRPSWRVRWEAKLTDSKWTKC
jgi:hypothetical protein